MQQKQGSCHHRDNGGGSDEGAGAGAVLGPAAARVVVVLLECLEEQFVIFGVGVTRVVNMVVGRVDPRRGELQPVLKKKSMKNIFKQMKKYFK